MAESERQVSPFQRTPSSVTSMIWIFVPLYFAATLYFALDRSGAIDLIGRFPTPLLLLLLLAIVLWSVVQPLGVLVQAAEEAPFALGFITG